MKVLFVHNSYQQPGGEDVVFQQECQLLERSGHGILKYLRHNDEICGYGLWSRATLGVRTVYAWDSCGDLCALLKQGTPDIAHFHNTFPLISPAAYYMCREAGIPVVQTLHNYRLLCPAATLFREGGICEECNQHNLWRSVYHGCYHDSRLATATVALMLTAHRRLRTWTKGVTSFIVPSQFARSKLVEGGLPADRIFVKPNFVSPDPGRHKEIGNYPLFVGRLSPEKGVSGLLDAWGRLHDRVPLWIVGDGPQRAELESEAARRGLSRIVWQGRLAHAQTLAAIKRARFLIFSSAWYETFGMGIVEAFACGVPVIVPRLGAMQELVEHERTGLHFAPGDAEDLAAKVEWAWTHPTEMAIMGREARAEYEGKYTAERNLQMLTEIYHRAIDSYQRCLVAS